MPDTDLPLTSGDLTRPGEPPDLEFDDLEEPEAKSVLDLLRAAAEEVVVRDEFEWAVPGRAGMAVRYTTKGLDGGRLVAVGDRAAKIEGKKRGDTATCLLLAHQAVGLVIDGQLVTDDGKPLTFGSPLIQQAFEVRTAADAVRVFYGGKDRDYGFAIQNHGNDLLTRAGLGDGAEELDDEEDPTKAAS